MGHASVGDLPIPGRRAGAAGRDRQYRRRLPGTDHDKRSQAITPNTVTPYIAEFSDLRNGPVVVELPARTDKASLYGQIVDAWQVTLADVGPSGLDKGAGGKYLLLPPGYSQPIPDGYFPIQSSTYRIGMAFRSVPAPTRPTRMPTPIARR